MDQNSTSLQSENSLFERQHIPWVERNGFAHWVVAIVWIILALLAFQIIGGIFSVILILPKVADPTNIEAIQKALMENVDLAFIANSTGQLLMIGLATFLIVKLHAVKGRRLSFLRLQKGENTLLITVLGLILFLTAQPAVSFLGWVNSLVPMPDVFTEMQTSMMDMITSFLKMDDVLIVGLFHIGIVPAVCEEILFRGYVMRSFEKSWGIVAAILVSGLFFGLYHIQLSNLLPLATLGILLAYLTWVSDSLIPAMFAHLMNNGGQVVVGVLKPEYLDMTQPEQFDMPLNLIILSFVVSGTLLYVMYKIKYSGTKTVE